MLTCSHVIHIIIHTHTHTGGKVSPVLLSPFLVYVVHEQVVCSQTGPGPSRDVAVLHGPLSYVQGCVLYARHP